MQEASKKKKYLLHFPGYAILRPALFLQEVDFNTHLVLYVFLSEPHTGAYSLVQNFGQRSSVRGK